MCQKSGQYHILLHNCKSLVRRPYPCSLHQFTYNCIKYSQVARKLFTRGIFLSNNRFIHFYRINQQVIRIPKSTIISFPLGNHLDLNVIFPFTKKSGFLSTKFYNNFLYIQPVLAFQYPSIQNKPVNLPLIVFLRSDIFAQILYFAKERDNIPHSKLIWDN